MCTHTCTHVSNACMHAHMTHTTHTIHITLNTPTIHITHITHTQHTTHTHLDCRHSTWTWWWTVSVSVGDNYRFIITVICCLPVVSVDLFNQTQAHVIDYKTTYLNYRFIDFSSTTTRYTKQAEGTVASVWHCLLVMKWIQMLPMLLCHPCLERA